MRLIDRPFYMNSDHENVSQVASELPVFLAVGLFNGM